MAERIMIFIDGSNLYHSLKHHFQRTDLDIGKFCHRLERRRQLIRIYYYNAKIGQKEEPERYKQQQAFFATVNAIPYSELRLGRLVYNNWPNVPPYEKGIDVQLATDMITHGFKNNYDVAILVAGDNDFVGAVQAVKDNGKHVEIALFGKEGTSRQLRDAADQVITINSRFVKDCWSKKSQQPQQPEQQQPPQQPEQQQQQPQQQQLQQQQPQQPEQQRPRQRRPRHRPPRQQQPQQQQLQQQQPQQPEQQRPRQRRPRHRPPRQQQPQPQQQTQRSDAG